ncbi:MAG: redoxin family protein [Chitinophagaceae bacterium]|jgi:thiol-disulfide isomerase/thioredoxin|nr:redoxin family protein [Chitinophagaceae bacterium]
MKPVILLLGLLLAGLAGTAQPDKEVATLTYRNFKEVPAFPLLDLEGKKFSSGSVRPKGKTLVVVYFSPTCSHCIEFTEQLTSKLKSFKNSQFLYVSAYPLEEIKTFAITRGFHKMPNFRVGQDAAFNMGRFYELKEIPGVFVYNKEGQLVKSFDSKLKMEDLIAAANQ